MSELSACSPVTCELSLRKVDLRRMVPENARRFVLGQSELWWGMYQLFGVDAILFCYMK